ncbi:MAG: SprB repeat-containing protein, partial [Opitutaceae bacterium]
ATTANSVAGANVSGQVSNALVAGTIYTNAQPNITSVGTLTSLDVSGTITAANITANTGVFTGNGNGLSSLVGANVTGQVNYAATANAVAGANVSGQVANALVAGTIYTNAQPNITSVGTLSSLAVTGDITGGNANVTGQLISTIATGTAPFVVTSTTKVANLNADTLDGYNTATANTASTIAVRDTNGNLNANYFIGNGSQLTGIDATSIQNGTSNVRTFLDANVTISSAGNANILTVTGTGVNVAGTLNTGPGNITAGNINAGNLLTANYSTSVLTTAAQPNITSVGTLTSLAITGNLTSGNANLGNLAQANYVQGTLTTAAQPNITSVGTLTSLAVTGNISGGNVNAGNLLTANYSTSVLTTAAQPNITSVGTLTALDVTGTFTSAPNNNGTINLTVTGGTPPYKYSWSDSTNIKTQNRTGLKPGTYIVTVLDTNSCTANTSFVINNGTPLTATAKVTAPACYGNKGTVTVTATGGNPPYQFSSDSINYSTIYNFSFAAGAHPIWVKDALNAIYTFSVTVTQPAAITATGTVKNVTTFGGNDGSISLVVAGGTLPYSYWWY